MDLVFVLFALLSLTVSELHSLVSSRRWLPTPSRPVFYRAWHSTSSPFTQEVAAIFLLYFGRTLLLLVICIVWCYTGGDVVAEIKQLNNLLNNYAPTKATNVLPQGLYVEWNSMGSSSIGFCGTLFGSRLVVLLYPFYGT